MTDFATLQQSLINAKKVMNKVDGGNFSSGESTNSSVGAGRMTDSTGLLREAPSPKLPDINIAGARKDLAPKSSMTEQKIKNSRLPDSIKEAMINHPIPDIPFGGSVGLSGDFISGVKEQMEKQNIPTSPISQNIPASPTSLNENIAPILQQKSHASKLTAKTLKKIIKETVKELLDEVVNTKINESVNMKSAENENFQFKVGNRIFYGKITSSKALK
tara:strand:+ start:4443 stop:5096 length:654 start_codon:yes stop_codon:yes gene_type:complete